MAEFFNMGGRAFFVWGSYGVFALFIAAELILLARRRRTIWRRLSRISRINDGVNDET